MANETITYKSYLMYSEDGSTYKKLIDIVDYPDMGGEPETVDVTTLSDSMYRNILGLQTADTLTFTANYDVETFTTLKSLEKTDLYFGLWFGGTGDDEEAVPTGELGQFNFKGQMSCRVTSAGVNEARRISLSIAASSVISFEVPASE